MFEIDSFYLIVLSIAIIILIIALGFMGWMLSHQKDDIKFPGITTTCPEFWEVTKSADDKITYCKKPNPSNFNYGTPAFGKTNVLLAYKAPGTIDIENVPGINPANDSFDSKDAGWGSGNDAICNKRKWANDNKINWDTVTNTNFC